MKATCDCGLVNCRFPVCRERKIVTTCICPPIPTRANDWAACWDGDEEKGPFGYGPTEAEAVKDLTENYDAPWLPRSWR